ncbi:iron complex outermembrane receptor protein [Filimonas zeae]|uniref:TonB-dependent receptor n=1 Tax=Filimonas zeae TaxID=1737353 RepID=A0A917J2W1_9BACT|nr:TonB-dependent receptor [Filimonas zeae]MDR6340661.1 iron complex outermembrane receptor protein [Filimonas zeae]GGH73775.1 TonB-dependent receptor [Filimonas zeae]
MQISEQLKNCIKFLCAFCMAFLLVLPFKSLHAQQGAGLLQTKITLRLTQVPLADALAAIGDKAGCTFSYSSNQLDAQKKVNAAFQDTPLETALKQLLGNRLKRLRVSGSQIFIQTAADKGSVKGKVVTADGRPAADVILQLQSTHYTTTTHADGSFQLEAEEGPYQLAASFVGLETQTQAVQITAGNAVAVNFTLTESSEQLEGIIVSTGKRNKFASRSSETAGKMPLKNMENAQVYTSVSKELIAEQVITDFGNVLKNTPGVYKIQGNRGINSDGASFYTIRGFRTEAALTDGLPMQTNGEIDPAYVERAEVLKGPSGTLYGGAITNLGGLINIITKKPVDTLGGEFSYTTGSFDLNRITADVYGAVNRSKTLLARVNAAYQYQGSFQDAGFRRTTLLAPALEYHASDKLSISLNAMFYNGEGTSPVSIFLHRTRQFIARTPEELNFDWKRSYTGNDITMKTPTTNVYSKITYKLSEQWTSQTNFSSNTRKSEGIYQYDFIRANTDERIERNVSMHNTTNTTLDLQQNFTGDFHIGRFRNRLLVGLDYVRQKANNNISAYVAFDTISAVAADPRYGNISRGAVEARIAAVTSGLTRNNSAVNIYSAYVSDVFNVTDRLNAMASVRADRYNSEGTFDRVAGAMVRDSKFDQTSVSTRLGVVYQVVKDKVSVFGNYMNGFLYLAPVVQPLPDISGVLKPQQANQWEGGVKLDVLKNRLSVTASYYNIELDKATRTEVVVRDNKNYNVTIQDGTQKSRGYEVEVIANPANGLNIIAGYGHNYSKLTKAIAALEGRRPVSAGPADLVNAWVSYSLQNGKCKGWGAGLGGNYISEHLTANSAVTGVFTLPAYTLMNATVYYDARWYRLAVKLDNISNRLYFAGQGVLTAQQPRSFSANLTVKF